LNFGALDSPRKLIGQSENILSGLVTIFYVSAFDALLYSKSSISKKLQGMNIKPQRLAILASLALLPVSLSIMADVSKA